MTDLPRPDGRPFCLEMWKQINARMSRPGEPAAGAPVLNHICQQAPNTPGEGEGGGEVQVAPCPLRAAPKGFGKQWQVSRGDTDPVASASCEQWGLQNAQNLSEPEFLHGQKGQEGSVSGSVHHHVLCWLGLVDAGGIGQLTISIASAQG